jgi:uncharacterized protein YqgC (DUF456 family)
MTPETIWAILLLVLMGGALVATLFGLPGTLIVFALALAYGAATGFAALTGKLLLALLGMALVAEVADQGLGVWAARRYGASVKGVIGSIAGAILGALLLSPLIPIAGGIIGAFGGAYLGALLVEQHVRQDWAAARRAAWGSFLGRTAGMVLKLVVGVGMMVIVGRAVFGS